MKNSQTTDWNVLLGSQKATRTLTKFATGQLSSAQVRKSFAYTPRAGEFRKLVSEHGAVYARRLTRKALRYRGLLATTGN